MEELKLSSKEAINVFNELLARNCQHVSSYVTEGVAFSSDILFAKPPEQTLDNAHNELKMAQTRIREFEKVVAAFRKQDKYTSIVNNQNDKLLTAEHTVKDTSSAKYGTEK